MLTSDEGVLLCVVIADERGSPAVVAILRQWFEAGLIDDMWVCYAGQCRDLGTDAPVVPAHSLSGRDVADLLQAAARDARVRALRGVFLHDADVAGLDESYVDAMRGIAGRALPADFSRRVGRAIADDIALADAVEAQTLAAAATTGARRCAIQRTNTEDVIFCMPLKQAKTKASSGRPASARVGRGPITRLRSTGWLHGI